MKFILLYFSLVVVLYSRTVTFDSTIDEALKHSIELKIIQTDAIINDAKIEEVKSLYYPTISVGYNSQYTKGLGDNSNNGISSIGDTVLSDTTQYESSLALKLNHNIYDFGVRSTKVQIAKIDRRLVDNRLLKNKQELKLKVLEIYAKILKLKKQLYFSQKIKNIEKKIYRAKQRLYRAGEIDKLAVSSQSIKIVELVTKLEQDKFFLDETLGELGFYTGRSYKRKTKFRLKKSSALKNILYEESLPYQEIDLQKEQKRKELKLVDNERYPKVSLYGKYNLYGQAECTPWCAFEDMKSRNYVI